MVCVYKGGEVKERRIYNKGNSFAFSMQKGWDKVFYLQESRTLFCAKKPLRKYTSRT